MSNNKLTINPTCERVLSSFFPEDTFLMLAESLMDKMETLQSNQHSKDYIKGFTAGYLEGYLLGFLTAIVDVARIMRNEHYDMSFISKIVGIDESFLCYLIEKG